MGLIKCPDCGKEVSDSAPSCPSCGKPFKKKKRTLGCLVAILIIAAVLVAFFALLLPPAKNSTGPSTSKTESSVNFNDIEKSVKGLMDSGFIKKLNPQLNEVFVSKAMWDTTNYDQKNTIGYVLAHYCGHKKGTDLYWVDIKDHRTGKDLAKWSKSWGMKIYD